MLSNTFYNIINQYERNIYYNKKQFKYFKEHTTFFNNRTNNRRSINSISKKNLIAYDETESQFISSTTYQLIPTILLSMSEEPYAKIATLILKIYQKEQKINNTLKSINFKEKLEILKEYALQNEPSIEVALEILKAINSTKK